MTRKILGFDSWTGGALNFARHVPALRARGYELQVVHLGSWGSDPGRPDHETINGLPLRDIKSYGGRSFEEILEAEAPDAVMFLSCEVFAHRAFNRYSLARGIPTLLLYHGLVSVQSVSGVKPYYVNIFSQARFVLARLPKALLHIWPSYAKSLWRTGAKASDWLRFGTDIIELATGKYIAHAAPDAKTTKVAVYTGADKAHAIRKYGHVGTDVTVVGNPDIERFQLRPEDVGAAATVATAERKEIVYIDTGLVYAGMVFDSPSDFVAHLTSTRDALAANGFTLLAKLHPDHFRSDLPDRLRALGIEVLDDDGFVPRLRACAAAIVEPSTAALIPCLLGLPILLAGYGKLAGQSFGDVLTGYPRARRLTDAHAAKALLRDEAERIDQEAVRSWLEENTGPLPASDMPNRVAALIDAMVENGNAAQCAA